MKLVKVALLVAGSIALTQCRGSEDTASEDAAATARAPAPSMDSGAAEASPPQIRAADLGRVCRAAVASLNGHDPSIVKIGSNEGGLVRVEYARPSDRKVWTNECRVEGNRVAWRTIDAFGAGSGAGRWRTAPADEVVTYEIDGKKVSITTTYPGESPSTQTYSVS